MLKTLVFMATEPSSGKRLSQMMSPRFLLIRLSICKHELSLLDSETNFSDILGSNPKWPLLSEEMTDDTSLACSGVKGFGFPGELPDEPAWVKKNLSNYHNNEIHEINMIFLTVI